VEPVTSTMKEASDRRSLKHVTIFLAIITTLLTALAVSQYWGTFNWTRKFGAVSLIGMLVMRLPFLFKMQAGEAKEKEENRLGIQPFEPYIWLLAAIMVFAN